MKLIRIIKSVRHLLFLNKLRVILSLIGIGVGITSVIIMVAIGEGARNKITSQIESMGSNLITIDAGKIEEVIGRKRQTTKATTLKEKDAEALLEECSYINLIAPTQDQTLLVKFRNGLTSARVIGTTSEYPQIRNYKISTGKFFTTNENRFSLRVAVLGQKIIEYLFNGTDPIGEIVRINNIPFEIIGVLKPKGLSYDGANEDEVIFIPLKTGIRRVFNVDYIKNIYVQVTEKIKMASAEEEIRSILRERHKLDIRNKEDDFTIQNMYTALKAENDTNESFTFLITGVATLSLIVGGVGILAIMLLSIKERKFEIGLRIAIGAKPNDILFQLLLEAVILSILGGMAGILSGIIGSYVLGSLTDLSTKVSLLSVTVSVAISVSIGVFFGAVPARTASLIKPVIALKG
ncbi:MAG: ABC transporter permease [Ignavibacteria bacterium]|jgi:putative ABC transport system permease protein